MPSTSIPVPDIVVSEVTFRMCSHRARGFLAHLLLISLHVLEERFLMRTLSWIAAAGAIALVGACSRTDNGDVVVKRPADISVQTKQDTLHMPSVTTHTDTVNTPVVGTKTETLVVKKPVIGSKKTEVQVPQVKKP